MIFTNCIIITRTDQFRGTVSVDQGQISDIDRTTSRSKGGIDLEGDFLLPGLIELHTDNLEKNIQPRPGVIWPSMLAAALAHDHQLTGAGITTVYDAVAVGGLRQSSLRAQILGDSIATIRRAKEMQLFKADHFLHLRCEVPDEHMEEMLYQHGHHPEVRLMSIMDHTPGQRQWTDLAKWRLYHRDKQWSNEEVEHILAERQQMQQTYAAKNRMIVVDFARIKNIPLASHDDTSPGDVRDAAASGVTIAEFPTTHDAASLAREYGMQVVMGAPNAIRGLSHSGNVPASILAEHHLLDALSSDYVPASLLHSAFHLSCTVNLPLTETIAMVSATPAKMTGLTDRGEISTGKKADLLQVRLIDSIPVIRRAWRAGQQIV
jgi:alpha-D-ribose 1-methylphosphonate 5-triphosphate diphosphatase